MVDKLIHILYADDDPVIKKLIGGQLAKRGFEVIYASDGNEAREMTRRLHPDLLLLDYRMPVFDGMKTASYLKKEETTKGIPIILLTNNDVPVEGQKYWKEMGIDDYIHKSEDFNALLEKVVNLLKSHGHELPPEMSTPIPKPKGLT